VDFGATQAPSVKFVSSTEIAAISPAGTGTVDVTVTTGAGTSAVTAADQFTYF
jgi:large repetitive protein